MTFEFLMANEVFQEKLCEAKDMAEVIRLFSNEGVVLSEKDLMNKILPDGQELTEDSLEDVSGGGAIMNWFRSKLGGGKGAFGRGGSAGGR